MHTRNRRSIEIPRFGFHPQRRIQIYISRQHTCNRDMHYYIAVVPVAVIGSGGARSSSRDRAFIAFLPASVSQLGDAQVRRVYI